MPPCSQDVSFSWKVTYSQSLNKLPHYTSHPGRSPWEGLRDCQRHSFLLSDKAFESRVANFLSSYLPQSLAGDWAHTYKQYKVSWGWSAGSAEDLSSVPSTHMEAYNLHNFSARGPRCPLSDPCEYTVGYASLHKGKLCLT